MTQTLWTSTKINRFLQSKASQKKKKSFSGTNKKEDGFFKLGAQGQN